MRKLALAAIRGYQRWLSPLKGFSCAFRVWSGAESCSAYGYRVIERFGLRRGLGLLDRRLALCGHVHRRMQPAATRSAPQHPLRRRQQGFCDLPCDAPCDLPACDLPSCHLPSCHLSGACDTVSPVLEACSCCDFGGCDCRPSRGNERTRNSAQMDAVSARVREQQERRRREAQNHRRPRAGGDPC